MRNSIKTLLFLTAFAPVLLSIALVKYVEHGWSKEIAYYLVVGLIGVVLTTLIIHALNKKSESISFTAKKIESNDALIVAFAFSYLFPFVAKAADITMEFALLIVGALAVIFWFIDSILPNPLLRVLKFRFYKVESSSGVVYTLIARRVLRDPKELRKVKRISESMLMDAS